MSLVLGGLFLFFSGPRSLQYKAERLGWSSSLLLQTEAALISDHGREQIDYRYVLHMTPLQKTQTIPLRLNKKLNNRTRAGQTELETSPELTEWRHKETHTTEKEVIDLNKLSEEEK